MKLRGFAMSTHSEPNLLTCSGSKPPCDKPVCQVGYDDVRAFLHHAITVRRVSSAYASHPVHPEGFKAVNNIIRYRTAALDGHVDQCDSCQDVKMLR